MTNSEVIYILFYVRLKSFIICRSALKGAGSFKFFTSDAGKVLHCIHETINAAIAAKKEAAKTPVHPEACSIPTPATTPNRNGRKGSVESCASEPSRTPPNVSVVPRHLSLSTSFELMSYEDKIRLDTCSPSLGAEDHRDGISFQSGSSSSNNSRFFQFDSQSTRSGTPSPQSIRQNWRNYFPNINQTVADSDKSNRTTSVSSTGSRDSGVILDSSIDFSSRTNVWVEEASQQSADRLSDIRESDSRKNSQTDIFQPVNSEASNADSAESKESDIARSQSFNQIKQHETESANDHRRFTCGANSKLPRGKRTKKISDIYIDLDFILAAKAELDLKLGRPTEETKVEETAVPPPLPPFPPLLKPLRGKAVPMTEDEPSREDIHDDQDIADNLQVQERKLSRSKKTSRSRKLSSTSNIYFEVGSLSDISETCANESVSEKPETSSDNETMEKRDRKVSNLYLDLDTVALLRTESFQSSLSKMNSLVPPELPPRGPSPRQKQKIGPGSSYGEVDRYRKNLAQFLGSPSYPKDIPTELPQRPTTLRPSKKSSEATSTVFSSIFGTLTRRKKRLDSTDAHASPSVNTSKVPPKKVQSVHEWPLPAVDSKVADNELYRTSTDEAFEVIDPISDNVFDDSEEPPPPFPPLMDPMRKAWYSDTENENGTNEANTTESGKSPDRRNSFSIPEEEEESFYMSMSGGQALTGTSPSSSNGDAGSLNATSASVENLIHSENPYLVMSNPDGTGNQESAQESDLYMNMGQLGES